MMNGFALCRAAQAANPVARNSPTQAAVGVLPPDTMSVFALDSGTSLEEISHQAQAGEDDQNCIHGSLLDDFRVRRPILSSYS